MPLGYFVTRRQFERPSFCTLVMWTKSSESGEVFSRQYPTLIDEAPLTAVIEIILQKELQTQNQKDKSANAGSVTSELFYPRHVWYLSCLVIWSSVLKRSAVRPPGA